MHASNASSDDVQRLRDQALAWFVRRRDAGWQTEEEPAFRAWLAADPRHADAYERCSRHWDSLDGMPADLLAGMRAPASAPPPSQPPSLPRRRFVSHPVLSAVGAAGVIGAIGLGYRAWHGTASRPAFTQALRTERGEQRSVELPDGSLLRLDTATRLDVTYDRGHREALLTEGRALFTIQPDADRPFHVLAGPLRITVVGTRFAVRHTPTLPDNAGVRIAVDEGKVRVSRRSTPDPSRADDREPAVLLTAGQQIVSDEHGKLGPASAIPPEGIALWRHQRISFVDVPLAHALAELERYRATGLIVRDPAVAALRLSGTFDPMATDALRAALPRVLPVRLRDRNGQTEILAAR
ncbi:MAG: FecR domain-containing protein [Burkholderiaceae bacterium]